MKRVADWRWVLLGGVVVLLAGGRGRAQESERPRGVEAAQVVRSEVEGFSVLLELLPQGSTVKAGDVIGVLDSSALRTARVDQEIRVCQAEAAHGIAERARAIAELELKVYQEGAVRRLTQQAEQAVARTRADHARAREQLEYWRNLYQKKLAPESNVVGAERAELLARHSAENAELELKQLLDVELKLQLAKLSANVENTKADAVLKGRVVELERGMLDRLESQIERCALRAGSDGIVSLVKLPSGDGVLQAGMAVHERQAVARIIPRLRAGTQ